MLPAVMEESFITIHWLLKKRKAAEEPAGTMADPSPNFWERHNGQRLTSAGDEDADLARGTEDPNILRVFLTKCHFPAAGHHAGVAMGKGPPLADAPVGRRWFKALKALQSFLGKTLRFFPCNYLI